MDITVDLRKMTPSYPKRWEPLCVCVCACVCVCVRVRVCVHTCTHTWLLSHVPLFATPWTVARQAPLRSPWHFPGKNIGVGCHFLFQGVKTMSTLSPALAGRVFTTVPPGKPSVFYKN